LLQTLLQDVHLTMLQMQLQHNMQATPKEQK
jgi:hypothetical protein